MFGQIVMQIEKDDTFITLNVSGLSKGAYILKIENQGNFSSRLIIIN